ncbi:MAG TPA: alpha-amylase family glycosyl hydrolase [Polyangia bacterium]|nr:alpha-amylase family glycosyl hydrolase [Polyangia bacterium]
MTASLATLRRTSFVLWAPAPFAPGAAAQSGPSLVIGKYTAAGDFDVTGCSVLAMKVVEPGLWSIAVVEAAPDDGVYGYWFQVDDLSTSNPGVVLMTDPLAFAVDRANPAPPPRTNNGWTIGAPASVIRVREGQLEPSDPIAADLPADADGYRAKLPTNTQMVIYELPTRWILATAGPNPGEADVGVGTFRDVLAMVSPAATSPHFSALKALDAGEHILELGVNALELLPPADSPQVLEWGYGTANYFSADFDLGHQEGTTRSTATSDLRALITTCHAHGIRFIQDVVMAFERESPYGRIAPDPLLDPVRNVFGGPCWAYHRGTADPPTGYDPVLGGSIAAWPARRYMLACVEHWLTFFHVDGVRIDDVADIDDWSFIGEYSARARAVWNALGGADERFWVVGESLGQSALFANKGGADGSWDETFKAMVRQLCTGVVPGGDLSAAVNTMIDCRARGFPDGRMVVNYIGSHDLTNDQFSKRFFDWLQDRGVWDKAPRFRLAFTCLLTAVGVPMILAGDEFAAAQTGAITGNADEDKQIDPVDFRSKYDPWRLDLFNYVGRLVRVRASTPALARNECAIIHVDATPGRLVVAWTRGVSPNLVVVVANFSDFMSSGGTSGEYVIPTWPNVPGATWTEVSQSSPGRKVTAPGKEPLFPWEAKVYVSST